MIEIFKEIPGFPDYKISNKATLKTFKFNPIGRILRVGQNGAGYKIAILTKNKKTYRILIHQLVAMAFLDHQPNGNKIIVDHINNNKQDNRVENLQIISQRSNLSKEIRGSSKFTGVCWHKRAKKWAASISVGGKISHLGYFTDEAEAAKAYKSALSKIN